MRRGAGVERRRKSADMVVMRMRADDGVELGNPERIAQIRINQLALRCIAAVNDHRVFTADENRRVALPDIEKVHRQLGL